jgi:hypothetical protein
MKIIYEQGDIVRNSNNHSYAIVLHEFEDGTMRILDILSDEVIVNHPPKSALEYLGKVDLRDRLLDIVESVVCKREN